MRGYEFSYQLTHRSIDQVDVAKLSIQLNPICKISTQLAKFGYL